MEPIKFRIAEEEFTIKQTFRSLLSFEEMTGKEYEDDGKLNNQFKMLYCMLKAANKDTFKYTWEEFIDVLDDNQKSVNDFFEYIESLADPNKKKLVSQ